MAGSIGKAGHCSVEVYKVFTGLQPSLSVSVAVAGLRQDCSHETWSDVAGLCSQQINLSPVAVTHRVKAPVPADLQDARGGRREPTLSSCPLTSARVPQHVHQCVHKHINKMIKK